jgi:hypothetical protein
VPERTQGDEDVEEIDAKVTPQWHGEPGGRVKLTASSRSREALDGEKGHHRIRP